MKKSNVCPICSGAMSEVIHLPGLPMTELYEPNTPEYIGHGWVDNCLLFCEACSHGKLETIVPPEMLYAKDYRTKTGKSVGASQSVMGFFAFMNRALKLEEYDVVIDIGGNDGSLLDFFNPRHEKINVDPNGSITDGKVIRSYIHEADLRDLKAKRKLIVSSHTLEHLEDPNQFLEKINDVLCYGDAVCLQFPSLDSLVRDARIDQVHHQHIHYYSLRSVSLLLAKYRLEITQYEFDDSHYGTLRLIARRGLCELMGDPIHLMGIRHAEDDFNAEIFSFDVRIQKLRSPIGYGASLMLPLLAYYAPSIQKLSSIADEDESKHGLRWINLNVGIAAPTNFKDRDVVVCAFNTKLAVRKIVNKLTNEGARTVLVPFHAL